MISFILGFFKPVFYFARNLYFLVFLNGFLIATILYFASEANYERQLFNTIAKKIAISSPEPFNSDSFAIKAMHMAYTLQVRRQKIFGDEHLTGFKAEIMHPSTVDLMTANGACGSYVTVLAAILKGYSFPIRIAQMKVNGKEGGHIILETKTKSRWIVLDPLYDQYFMKSDGNIANIKDIQSNWDYYKKQTKENYIQSYSYDEVRYTNWNKIPVIMPAIKKMLDLTIGKEKADEISIRPYFLRLYHITTIALSFIYLIILYYTIRRIFARKNINADAIKQVVNNISEKKLVKTA